MIPVLECWCKVVRERGILLECHAQNILLEIDDNFNPSRIVHRDFDVWIDAKRRKQNGLDSPFTGGIIEEDTLYSQKEHYSLVYDHFIGHELFDFLLEVLIRFFSVEEALIQSKIKEAFHLNFPDADFFFPKDTTYYFSNEMLPDNEFRLVNTKEAPKWR